MKLQGCKTEHGNASAFIHYLMRTGETGLLCTSEIMRSGEFKKGVALLQYQQKTDFLKQFGDKLDWWRNRKLTENDSAKVHANRARIMARAGLIEDEGLKRKCHRTEMHTYTQELVHSICVTQKFHQTAGAYSGKEFIEPLPKSLLTDPDGAEKIKAAVLAVRDCFPKNLPLVLTVHFDKKSHNPHVQGWVSEKAWDSEKGCWEKPHELLDTAAGLQKLWQDVAQAVTNATGTAFNRDKASDPERPKRTVFHPRTAYWVQQLPHSELLKGDFLKLEQNPKAREATRQLIVQVRYDQAALQQSNESKRFDAVLSSVEEVGALFKSPHATMRPETSDSATSSANELAAAMKHYSSLPRKSKTSWRAS